MTTTTCTCVRHTDGSVTTFLCSTHADTDPCLTTARVTGRRRRGSIRRGVCSACGWRAGDDTGSAAWVLLLAVPGLLLALLVAVKIAAILSAVPAVAGQ